MPSCFLSRPRWACSVRIIGELIDAALSSGRPSPRRSHRIHAGNSGPKVGNEPPTFAFAWRNLEGSPQYRPAESDAVGYVSGCPNQPMMGDLCRSDFALQHGLIGVHK